MISSHQNNKNTVKSSSLSLNSQNSIQKKLFFKKIWNNITNTVKTSTTKSKTTQNGLSNGEEPEKTVIHYEQEDEYNMLDI